MTGLYTTIACLVAYAVFGPSKVLVLGPDSSVSPLILVAITPLIVTGDPKSAIELAGMLAILVGLIEIGLGVAKLGFVADLLSSEVRVGYLNGLAITIIVGQLPKLFGFSTSADNFIGEVRAFFDGLDQTNRATLLTGLCVLAVLLVLPRITSRVPAVLVAVVGVTVVSAVLDLAAHGVKTVGTLPQGVPVPALPWTKLSDVGPLLLGAVGITMVSLTDTIATATSFAAKRGDEVNPDQEMVGIGTSNIAAGFFQGFAVSVSGSRTAVADQSGAKTQMTGLVGAGLVAVLLLFLNGLLADLPQTALAAVVITAALSLMDLGALRRFAEVRTSSLVVSLVATAGVMLPRGAPRDRRGDRPDRPAVLSPRLAAPRRRPRRRTCTRGMAQHRQVPGGDRAARESSCSDGRRRSSSPTAASSGTRSGSWPASGARRGSCCSARRSRTSTSPPPRCSKHWTRSSMTAASIWPSSSCAIASRTWSAATAFTPRSTRSTSTRASTRHSMRSPTRPGTNPRPPDEGMTPP